MEKRDGREGYIMARRDTHTSRAGREAAVKDGRFDSRQDELEGQRSKLKAKSKQATQPPGRETSGSRMCQYFGVL